jgi:hypothetical protein
MASHFRLHVLLPIAVLGLLGIGVGAFAFGHRPLPGAGDPETPLSPLAGTTTQAQNDREVAKWASKADAWCAGINTTLAKVEAPTTDDQLDLWLAKVVQINDRAAADFPKLGYPKRQKSAVLGLQRNLRATALSVHAAFRALRSADQFAFQRAVKRWGELETNWDSQMRRLGALVCAAEAADAASARSIAKYGSAGAALNAALLHKKVAVVLFYAPGDDYDTIQTRETRGGALDAKVGFLALDVTQNDEVAALASQFDVRNAPATIIFVRGPKVFYRVDGYMDRQAVAQAATDARNR